jgi:hypothetical protein
MNSAEEAASRRSWDFQKLHHSQLPRPPIYALRQKSNRKVIHEGLAFLVKPAQDIPVHRLLLANLLEVLGRQQNYIPERHHPFLVQLGPCFGAELRLQVINLRSSSRSSPNFLAISEDS